MPVKKTIVQELQADQQKLLLTFRSLAAQVRAKTGESIAEPQLAQVGPYSCEEALANITVLETANAAIISKITAFQPPKVSPLPQTATAPRPATVTATPPRKLSMIEACRQAKETGRIPADDPPKLSQNTILILQHFGVRSLDELSTLRASQRAKTK